MKVELPITKDYLPSWGKWHGFREIIQNGLDQEIQDGNRLIVRFCQINEKDSIEIRNEGAVLDRKAFLFGYTTKTGNDACIGQYGEGLKLGILALLRAGVEIELDVGPDRWKACFIHSRKFGTTILGFNVIKNMWTYPHDVCVYLIGIKKEEYEELISKRLLAVGDGRNIIRLKGADYYGDLLPEPEMKGKIFVKGVWVQDKPNMEFGYNLTSVKLNRDRDIIEDWAVGYYSALVINSVLDSKTNYEQEILNRIYHGIFMNPDSVESKELSNCLNKEHIGRLATTFKIEHGLHAVPVATQEAVIQAQFLNRSGIVVPQSMVKALAKVEGLGIRDELNDIKVTKVYQLSELSEEEQTMFSTAYDILALVKNNRDNPIAGECKFQVVEFNKATVLGTFLSGQISIARMVLSRSLAMVLAVFAHELAHIISADGTKDHIESQIILLSEIIEILWKQSRIN